MRRDSGLFLAKAFTCFRRDWWTAPRVHLRRSTPRFRTRHAAETNYHGLGNHRPLASRPATCTVLEYTLARSACAGLALVVVVVRATGKVTLRRVPGTHFNNMLLLFGPLAAATTPALAVCLDSWFIFRRLHCRLPLQASPSKGSESVRSVRSVLASWQNRYTFEGSVLERYGQRLERLFSAASKM